MKRRGFLSGLTLSAAGIPMLAKAGEEESVFGIPNSLKGPSSDSEPQCCIKNLTKARLVPA